MSTYNFIDRAGQVLGRLTVTEKDPSKKRTYWLCKCECGNDTTVRGDHLKEGRVTSCGCYSEESHTKHGMSRTKTYHCWQAMKDRCYNKLNKGYKDYGYRGIIVCNSWLESFDNFYKDMGEMPKGLSIDRMDNNKGYSPENCRWATNKQQVDNRRNVTNTTINGETMCLKDWSRRYSIPYTTVRHRISKGQSIEQALKLI